MEASLRILPFLCLAALVATPAIAAPMTAPARGTFIKSCVAQMYMSAGACGCVADQAGQQLDEPSIAYLEIQSNNGPAAAAAAKKLSSADIGRIDKFMRSVPDQCSKGN